jgi:integrase
MANSHLRLVTPATLNRTVAPKRRPNADLRTREHLTETEVERLIEVAKRNRWGHRDATMVLVAYRHGLRASELVDLRWDQIEFASGALHVRRVKRGTPSTHPVLGDELRALRRLSASRSPSRPSCSLQSGARPSAPLASPAWWSEPGLKQGSASRPTRTCSGTLAVTRSPTRGTTRERCKPTSGTAISSTRCDTPSCRRRDLRTSGEYRARSSGLRDERHSLS